MSFKIDLNSKIQSSFEGPSSSYRTAQNRFNSILTEKLGVRKSANGLVSSVKNDLKDVFVDVRKSSGVTAQFIDEKLKDTQMAGLGNAFIRAEKEHGVNAMFLTGLAIHESAYGNSRIAQDKKNLFGFQAYDASPYASARTFSSYEDSIDVVAAYLSRAYLTPGGAHYNGFGIDDIGKKYATDPNWPNAIKAHMTRLMEG